MRTVKLPVLLLTAVLFALPRAAPAQEKAQLYHFTPEGDAQASFEAALQRHAEWREQQGDPWSWSVCQVVQGDDVGTWIVRSGGHAWSDFDAYGQGFGPRGERHFNTYVAPLVEETRAYVEDVDTTLTRLPEDMEGPAPLVSVTTYHLKPGGGEDWWAAAEKFHEAITREDAPGQYYVLARLGPGAGQAARVASLYESWAGFAEPDPSFVEVMHEAYGEEETEELFERFSSSYRSLDNMVVRCPADLSVEGTE